MHTDNKKLQVYLSDYLRQDTLYGHKMYDTTFCGVVCSRNSTLTKLRLCCVRSHQTKRRGLQEEFKCEPESTDEKTG